MEAIILVLIVFIIWAAFMAFIVGSIVLWVLMLIDAAKRTNWSDENEKILWIVLMLLVGPICSIIYYSAVYRPRGKAVAVAVDVPAATAAKQPEAKTAAKPTTKTD